MMTFNSYQYKSWAAMETFFLEPNNEFEQQFL